MQSPWQFSRTLWFKEKDKDKDFVVEDKVEDL